MSDLYRAVLRGAEESTGAGEQIALNRATAAMNQLMERITTLREAEYEGWDSGQVIRARVSGTGRVLAVEISGHAVRDVPTDQMGPRCVEAVTAARVAMSESIREALTELSGGATPVDAPADLPDFQEYWRTKVAEQR
jgi:hypothetical protein